MNLSKITKSGQAGGDVRVIKGVAGSSKWPQLEVAALKVIQGQVEETYKGVYL